MAQMNDKQLKGKESIKNSKGTSVPPKTALGKPGLDDSLTNPRAYLGEGGDGFKDGYRVITNDLDPFDRERNPVGGIDEDNDDDSTEAE